MFDDDSLLFRIHDLMICAVNGPVESRDLKLDTGEVRSQNCWFR